jgi:2'-5' RNA ligase
LQPPADLTRDALAGIDRLLAVPGWRRSAAEDLHVTLRFCGDVADTDELLDALWNARATLRATRVSVSGPAMILGDRALVLPVTGADALAAAVSAVVEPFACPNPHRSFIGHLTVGQLDPEERLPGETLGGVSVVCSWAPPEVCLYASLSATPGGRYRVLGRVPLTPPPAIVGRP